ncbi:hypothetical protein BC962_3270 [Gillisia mitskevichiae]|uniref:Uncharacterized protein n=1 Tax=Gillisia mitskevichiae TaxID=270921 RepID=A0A495NZD6_9FLAO|nr:hypothetical protein [Gillisia mitskevichiae]RKS42512.1 hypothetical protein BC962_3270 [Gillisia mitskevichiae]
MYENLNKLIDINLDLLSRKEDHSEFFFDFINLEKQKFRQSGEHIQAERLAENMEEKGLITIDQELAILSEFGYSVVKIGGWSQYLKAKLEEKMKIESDTQEKEKLEIDNLKLQKENLEYQKSIRAKEEQIQTLTRDNLRLGNWDIRFRWYIAIITFVIGFIIKYFVENQ